MNVIKRWRTCHNKYTLCSENILQFMSDLFIPLTASWSSFLYLFPGAFVMVRSTCYVKKIFPFCQAQNFEAFLCTLHKTIFSAFSSSWGFFSFFFSGTGVSTPARGLEPLRPRLDVGVDWGARTQLRQSLVLRIGPYIWVPNSHQRNSRFSRFLENCKRLPSHTGQEQACTRITWLVGWLVG